MSLFVFKLFVELLLFRQNRRVVEFYKLHRT